MDENIEENNISTPIQIQLQEAVGLVNHKTPPNYRFYPNPVMDMLHIDLSESSRLKGKTAEVTIIDYTGKLVQIDFLTGRNNSIDVSDFVPGSYVVVIESSGIIQANKLLIH